MFSAFITYKLPFFSVLWYKNTINSIFPIPDSSLVPHLPLWGNACKGNVKTELGLLVRSSTCWFSHNPGRIWLIFKLIGAINFAIAFDNEFIPFLNAYSETRIGLTFPLFSSWVKINFSLPWSSFLCTYFSPIVLNSLVSYPWVCDR